MRLLTNPLFFRAAMVLLCSVAAFVIGVVAVRMLRQSIVETDDLSDSSDSETSLPVQAYTVIQQLKQQKFALQNEQQQQRRRTKTSEHITASIIANLPVGMLFVGPNGLVRQANAAARRILGFASPMGLSMAEIFRETRVLSEDGHGITATAAFSKALHGEPCHEILEVCYITPSGQDRSLKITLIPVCVPGGEILGLASVIADHGEAAALRQARVLRAEESAELALDLRTSLVTIREWAEQMKAAGADSGGGLAGDISAEAGRMEKVVREFLAGDEQAKGAHA